VRVTFRVGSPADETEPSCPPVQTWNASVGTPIVISASCTDDDPILYGLVSSTGPDPVVGTITPASPTSVNFNPVGEGTTSFFYSASDGRRTVVRRVIVEVGPGVPNSAPVCPEFTELTVLQGAR
jgi:hypothetical protein